MCCSCQPVCTSGYWWICTRKWCQGCRTLSSFRTSWQRLTALVVPSVSLHWTDSSSSSTTTTCKCLPSVTIQDFTPRYALPTTWVVNICLSENIQTSTRSCTDCWSRPFFTSNTAHDSSSSRICSWRPRTSSESELCFASEWQQLFWKLTKTKLQFRRSFCAVACRHLPAYMVAAFIKRLARLALTAPPSGLEIIIPFIYNLLLRHPNCRVLVHKPGGPKGSCFYFVCANEVIAPKQTHSARKIDFVSFSWSDLVTDPYNAEEPDPEKSNALASSLWELKTLQHHYHHFLARKATQISRSQQSEEISLQELLEMKTSDVSFVLNTVEQSSWCDIFAFVLDIVCNESFPFCRYFTRNWRTE